MSTRTFLPTRANRRGTELFLLIFACLLSTGAVAAVVLAHDGKVTGAVGYYGAGFFGLYLVAHLAIRKLAPAADPLLLPVMAMINGIGLAMIYRIDLALADRASRLGRSAPSQYAPMQLIWTFAGVAILIAVLVVVRDHRVLARYTYTAGLVGLLLLVLLGVPGIGQTVNGARLQIRLGPIPFQPSEFSKILLIIFFAGYLVRKREVLSVVTHRYLGIAFPRARDLGPVLAAWAASLLVLVFAKDLGTSLLFFSLFLVMLYIATERASWLVIGLTMAVVGSYLAYQSFGHVQTRVNNWLHPFQGTRPLNQSYQLVQGLFGLATGGLFGTGLGQGRPELVPFANTDFILSSVGEELGAVGVMALLVLYGLIVARGLRVALIARDGFGKLLAAGLGAAFAIQLFVVAGGVLRVIPETGQVMPFLAYGGSSMMANAALMALLLRISDAGRRPPPPSGSAPLYDPRAISDSPTQAVQL